MDRLERILEGYLEEVWKEKVVGVEKFLERS